MAFTALVPSIYYNVKQYGAAGDGVTDDTTAIAAAITAASGSGVFLPAGIYQISSPLSLSTANTHLIGAGPGTILRPTAGFTGSQIIGITADGCGVRDLYIKYANSTSSGNPAANGIEITGARIAYLSGLQIYYINGWAIESIGTAGVNNVAAIMHAIHVNHCAQGIHIKGVTGSNFVGQNLLSDILLEVIDNGDGFFLEDINDCQLTNIGGAVAGGSVSGSAIHIKGGASNTIINIDVGMITTGTVSPTILIETGTADPNNITFVGGVAQNGNQAVQITAANNIKFTSMLFKHSNADGVNISGTGGPITFKDCNWATNNQSNTTAYEFNDSQSAGNSYLEGCIFQSPVGSGAGLVTNAINDTNHRGYFFNCHFAGTGNTPSNTFAGTPQIARSCIGYNPRGSITPTAIGASPFTGNSSQNDIQIIFTAINTMTAFSIGGTNIGSVPTAGVPYRVPARQSFIITYSGAAPTYIWLAD